MKRKTSKAKPFKIQSTEAYALAMQKIDALMKRGEKNILPAERKTLRALAASAQMYEDSFNPLTVPASLSETIRFKLFQLQINQNLAAQLLHVSNAKFPLS